MIQKPPNLPVQLTCWGQKYQDGDQECNQCAFKDSCRNAVLIQAASRPIQPAKVVPLPTTPLFHPHPAQPVVPQPTYRPNQPTALVPVQVQQYPTYQPAPQPVPQPAPTYMANIPDTNHPNPMAPMMRPGASGPPYYFTQYPGESVLQRLGKNMLLRGGATMFGELAYFFNHWTWPPRS